MAVELAAQVVGDGPPLVVLHGLFGSGRNWATMARRLGDLRRAHLLDARNHGASPWADTMSYPEMAGDVAAYIESRRLAPADVLGHSMGGKTAMTLALARPELVARLIVADIAPVPYSKDDQTGYAQAMLAARLAGAASRGAVEAQLAGAVPDPVLRAFLMQNLVGDPGAYRWRINLAAIVAQMPALLDFPAVAGQVFRGPTSFVRGETSRYVQPRHGEAIARLFPAATTATVEGAGHWLHAEQPDRFLALARAALL